MSKHISIQSFRFGRAETPHPLPAFRQAARDGRGGFSLLEILLAVTVLILIVMMMSLVFQQTQNAWSSGVRTTNVDTTLRTVLGFVERDLTHAIDATPYGQFNTTNNIALGVSGVFELMTLDGDATTTTNRLPQLVGYDLHTSVTGSGLDLVRSVYPMTVVGGGWTVGAATNTATLNGATPLTKFGITFIGAPAGSAGALPLRADVEAHVQTSAKDQIFAVVSGRSAGPDGVFGTGPSDPAGKDDIVGQPDQ
jgi:hypothetical protein